MVVLCFHQLIAQNESSLAINGMKKAIGKVIDGYTTYSYPTNNYGVGTSCNRRWAPKGIMISDMIEAYGLSKVGMDNEAWKTVNGIAYRGDGGQLQLTDSVNKSYGIGLLLPKILQALNINIAADVNKIRSIRLVIDSAMLRYLNYGAFKNFVDSRKYPQLTDAWNKKKLLLITSDFVLLNYSLEINPSDSFGIALGAKLDEAINVIPNILTGNDSLGIRISKHGSGQFILTSVRPVVFAVYIKKQKNIETMGTEMSFDDWDVVKNIVDIDPDEYKK
jgi:hypothetical protein